MFSHHKPVRTVRLKDGRDVGIYHPASCEQFAERMLKALEVTKQDPSQSSSPILDVVFDSLTDMDARGCTETDKEILGVAVLEVMRELTVTDDEIPGGVDRWVWKLIMRCVEDFTHSWTSTILDEELERNRRRRRPEQVDPVRQHVRESLGLASKPPRKPPAPAIPLELDESNPREAKVWSKAGWQKVPLTSSQQFKVLRTLLDEFKKSGKGLSKDELVDKSHITGAVGVYHRMRKREPLGSILNEGQGRRGRGSGQAYRIVRPDRD
jgi:hypothetical protein